MSSSSDPLEAASTDPSFEAANGTFESDPDGCPTPTDCRAPDSIRGTASSVSEAASALNDVERVYNRVFWLCFAANLTMVTANSLTFRFAELVVFLGGTEQTTGQIVQAGMIGALVIRLFLGRWLDVFGTRKVWACSTSLFLTACLVFTLCRDLSWVMYASRVAFACGIAGMSTAGILHIQNQVPEHRRTEVIGNFGSSGFLGMMLGSQLGDLIFHVFSPAGKTSLPWLYDFAVWLAGDEIAVASSSSHLRYAVLFGMASVMAVCNLGLVFAITHGNTHVRPLHTPPIHRLIVSYWPGPIFAVAVMMGIGFTVTTVFLTRMTTYRELGGIGWFFVGYCLSAFVFRVASASWPARFGREKVALLGLCGHGIGHIILAMANADWHLIGASLVCGFGHALLFPSVVTLGAGRYPREYRGTGTTIILGFTEVGVAISAPLLGAIIDHGKAAQLADPFAPMFYVSSASAFSIALLFGWLTRGQKT